MEIVRLSGFLIDINPYIRSLWELEIKIFLGLRRKWLGSLLYMRNTRKKKKKNNLYLLFKQPPFYHKWYFMTEPFRVTYQLKRKQLPWEYRQWKRVLLLMWWSKPAVFFILKRNAKYPCWYLRHQIRYISRFFHL